MNLLRTWISRTCAIAICGALISPAHAYQQEYRFTYSKLYTQLKHNAEDDHESARLGIFFVESKSGLPCQIDKAWMEKEEKYEALGTAPNGELQLPLDSHLRQANPLVFVHIDQITQCDFSMVVMSREPLKQQVDYQHLANLKGDMQLLLGKLGGMFARWFTPDIEGVTLEFAQPMGEVKISDGTTLSIVDHRVSVDLRELTQDQYLILPAETLRVMPYIPSAN